MAEHQVSVPAVDTIEDAQFWLGVHHRASVRDAERMNVIEARLDLLETPWWRFLMRRRHRAFLAFVQAQRGSGRG